MKEINSMPIREALGLTESFSESLIESFSISKHPDILRSNKFALLEILASINEPLERRYLAASYINMIGDPRFESLNPEMIEIPAAQVKIGLKNEDYKKIAQSFKDIFVKEEWIEKECPQHIVNLASFKIARYPVTNFEYRRFLKDTQHKKLPTSWDLGLYPMNKGNHPVYGISVDDARLYCEWLSKKLSRKFKLPSEFEWEYAAAGPDSLEYPWGHEYKSGFGNSLEEGFYQSTPVGIFPAGRTYFGLDDMGGNVEEFTSSLYRPYPNGKLIRDDLYQSLGDHYVARGGSCLRYRDLMRCKRRHGAYPSPLYIIGFRIAEY